MLAMAALVGAFAAAAGPGAVSAAGQALPHALVVLPPGEGSSITLAAFGRNQATGDCSDLGPHVCDQLQTYEQWRFRDGTLAPTPNAVSRPESQEQPQPGVTIVRDSAGVPHVYADGSDEATIERRLAFGIGYAQAEERLFQMEILRRAGEGRLSDLLGQQYLQMDVVTRRDSEAAGERQAALATLSPGDRASLQSYADGINAVIARDSQDPSQLPAGFSVLQDLPIAPWTPSDTLAIGILEVKNVAESGGNELGYGALARRLAGRYGAAKAAAILDDLQLTNDPQTPTTIPQAQEAGRTTDGARFGLVNRDRQDTARLIGQLDPTVEPAYRELLTGEQAVAHANTSLGLPVFGSNAWAISPSRSSTGGALLWGGPQVGYYVPPVFDELEAQGGAIHVRGVAVPGAGPEVTIGYTPHTAWSITTTQDDQVDTYVDRIRAAPGGGYEYFWRGSWRPVGQRTETIRVRQQSPSIPLANQQLGLPTYQDYSTTFYRTEHGPPGAALPCAVVYLDARAGLSYCKVRAFWNAELRSGEALVAVNKATNLDQFDRAVRQNVAGFNFMYADDRGHIGYWHTGRMPVLASGQDPRLPVPGDGSYDWRGFLPSSQLPSVVDPAQGYLASWNNKPQASWPDTGDGTLWGGTQRVRQPMSLLAGPPRFDLSTLWQVARRTGELDLRATLGFKPLLTGLASRPDLSPIERQAVALVAGWDGTAFYPDGAERTATGQETGNVASPGFAILNGWFASLESRVAAPVFGPVVSGSDTAGGLRAFAQNPSTASPQYEFFDDYDQFMYDALYGRARAASYLGGRTALDVSRAALADAVKQLSSNQGTDPTRWRLPMPQINFQALDVSGIPSAPWENRGTWGQAVALPPSPSSPSPSTGAGSRSCTLRLAIHRPRHGRIVRVTAFIRGRRVAVSRGHNVRHLVIGSLPQGSFRLRVVARNSRGRRRVTVRRYRGCRRTAPNHRSRPARGGHPGRARRAAKM
jgi:penicillin amidase